ncbi:hypothetical protein Plav_0026 [Parvibaculum lavamentivorans DS-1]|uniref:NAD-specific glutamate dehydrogenase n=1 Tax=Parvibaculum lavamentivorans (strain DS-1 / DSM 13023 / NCIMB 13966) TaxID=402881 RepID=A7HP16_PARL1|nr:hypothetical protein Plav_0026 [Parvibaculum lavamentivorans DS-1]
MRPLQRVETKRAASEEAAQFVRGDRVEGTLLRLRFTQLVVRRLFRGGDAYILQRIGIGAEIDLLQIADAVLGDIVADHAVAFMAQLFHVHIGGVEGLGAVGDDAGLEQRLDEHAEDVGAFLHALAAVFIAEGFEHLELHLLPFETELAVDRLLLLGVHEVEQQGLEALGRPVLDDVLLFFREVRDRAVGPDLAELVMEGFVRHHELRQLDEERIVRLRVKRREGAHGKAFDQHLHADDLLVDLRCVDDVGEQAAQRRADGEGLAPTRLDVFREGRHMAGFFAGLVGGIFLRARILQDVAERGGKRQRAGFAMQDRREHPARALIREFHALLFRQLLEAGQAQLRHQLARHHHLVFEIEGFGEVDVLLVQRIPEMVVGRGNDLVEGGGAGAVTFRLHHRREIMGGDGIIGVVFGDLPNFGHQGFSRGSAGTRGRRERGKPDFEGERPPAGLFCFRKE